MTFAGWLIMFCSTIGMTVFFAWCLWKVLATPKSAEHVHAQLDIDPGDTTE
jgi:uncharacterized membrane protein